MSLACKSGQWAAGIAMSVLMACGGGGGGDGPAATGATSSPAATSASASPGGPANAQTPAASSSPTASDGSANAPVFAANLSQAPADAATLTGTVRLAVSGSGLANVELLPANGYTPRVGVFSISPDGTTARLDLNTAALASGLTQLRVSAFSAPAGDPSAREIVAMPARTWVIINPPATAPILIQLSDLPLRDPAPLIALDGLSDSDLSAKLSNDWPGVESVLRLYIPANVDFDFPVPLGFYGPWVSCLQQHGLAACREHITQLIGLMNSKRPP